MVPRASQKAACRAISSPGQPSHRAETAEAKGCQGSAPSAASANVSPKKREPTWIKMKPPTMAESRRMPKRALGWSRVDSRVVRLAGLST